MPSLFAVLLMTHVALAIALFVPGVLLPFTLRSREPGTLPGRLVRTLRWLELNGTAVIGAGLAATGLGMVVVLGPTILAQPWLLTALAIYGVAAVVAFAIQRPDLARLLGRGRGTTEDERQAWRTGARRQRYLAYGLTGLVGVIGVLMSTKPELW